MIQLTKINKIFNHNSSKEFQALKNINLEIKKKELVLLKGASGSGKSTLLSIIASFSKPTDGSVIVMGEQIAKLPDLHVSQFRLNNIGFVFQSFNLIEYLTVQENLLPSLVPLPTDLFSNKSKIEKTLKLIDIEHKKDQLVATLSGGEKQRVAIARAIINDPDIILCDEPTASLDTKNSLLFIELLQKLQSLGKTIIVATHDTIFDNLNLPHRVVEIEKGELL